MPAQIRPGLFCASLICAVGLAAAAVAAPPPANTRAGLSLDLNGAWRAQPADSVDTPPAADPESWGSMNAPGQAHSIRRGKGNVWNNINIGKLPAVWLERDAPIPDGWRGKRILLRSELIEQPATVFVDGEKIGVFQPPGDEIELTAVLAPGKTHMLRLFIARGEDVREGAPHHMIPCIGPLGIAGSLRLDALAGRIAIDDVFLMPSVRKKQLGARVRFHCAKPVNSLTLEASVFDADEKGIGRRPVRVFRTTVSTLKAGEVFADVAFPWDDPILWELERPHLYRITIRAIDEQRQTLDNWGPETFGFREFRVEGRHMILNGHPCRFRLLWHWGVGENNLAFYQGIGFNAVAIQPRDSTWFNNWGANGDIDKLAGPLDRRGMALVATGKNMNGIERLVKDSPAMRAYFKRASRIRISRYANRPSILVWNLSLNVGNSLAEWMPTELGRTPKGERADHPVAIAADIVDKLDPTRSVMSHAAGNIAPVTSANVYLNLIPLQEREEWLSAWAEDGERPFSAIEFGSPYSANFFRKGGPEPEFTEYCAIFLGDEAYRMEKTAYVEQVERLTKANANGHGSSGSIEVDGASIPLQTFAAENTAFFPVVAEFVRRTNRAWRTWGFNGGAHPWMWMIGFGGKPGGPMGAFFYTHLEGTDEELRKRPEWANPYYDAYRETSQPILVYIGGPRERFTAKDHSFFPGEKVEKQIIAVWDGGRPTEIFARWKVALGGRELPRSGYVAPQRVIAEDIVRITLPPGTIRKVPFSFRIPEDGFGSIGEGKITLTVRNREAGQLARDGFDFQVFRRPESLKKTVKDLNPKTKVLLWDPKGESGPWLRDLGLKTKRWRPGSPIGDATALIIGRNALTGTDSLPFSLQDINLGLYVLILEQQPETLERFGFRAEETYSRRFFPRYHTESIFGQVFKPEDFRDWRASATLVSEHSPVNMNPVRPRSAHWGNYGIVASVVIEIPHHGNFIPLLDGEFDMRYSPLLEWRCGERAGRLVFSQLDLTGRVGSDPAATMFAHALLVRLIMHRREWKSWPRQAAYIGGPAGRKLVADTLLRVDLNGRVDNPPKNGLLVVGEGVADDLAAHAEDLQQFVKSGGRVLSLPKSPQELNAGWLPFRMRTERRKAHRAGTEPIDGLPFRGLGPADFHWRDIAEFDVFTADGQAEGARVLGDGFFLTKQQGRGGWVLSQADPAPFSVEKAGTVDLLAVFPASWYTDRKNTRSVPKPWLRRTHQRFDRMYAQIIANLGAGPGADLCRRLTQFVAPPKFAPLDGWQYAGPYENANFDKLLPPEPGWNEQDPNQPAPVAAWQAAETDGLSIQAPDWPSIGKPSVTYFRTFIDSDRDATVPMRFSPGWSADAAVWCNDEAVERFKNEGWGPRWAIEAELRLKKGRNELLLKVHGRPRLEVVVQQLPDPRLGDAGADLFYRDPLRYGDDPYAWFPW